MKIYKYLKLYIFLAVLGFFTNASATEVVWNMVTKYNINPADAKATVSLAISDAISYLNTNSGNTLVLYFPSGTYEFYHPGASGVRILNLNNGSLIIRGEGPYNTKLVFHDIKEKAIEIRNSRNITIEQMHITRPGLYTSQGRVSVVTLNYVDFEVHEGFPDPAALYDLVDHTRFEFAIFEFSGPDSLPQMSPDVRKIRLDDLQDIGGGSFRAVKQTPSQETGLVAGDRIALKSKVGEPSLWTIGSDNLIFQDLLFTRSAGNPIMFRDAENVIARRIVVKRAEAINGKVPFISGSSGGIQLLGVNGATIEDCVIMGTADDGVGHFLYQNANITLRNNIFFENMSRGIYINSVDGGLYENNTIIRSVESAVQISVGDGDISRNLTVRNNTVVQPWHAPTFYLRRVYPHEWEHENIVFAENLILEASKNNPLFEITRTKNILIENNEIISFSPEEDNPGGFGGTGITDALILIGSAGSVSGDGNIYSGSELTRPLLDKRDASADVSMSWDEDELLRYKATDDTYLESKFPDRINGDSGIIWMDNALNIEKLGLFKFELTGIPVDHEVVDVKLRIMPVDLLHPFVNPKLYNCSDNSWQEENVTWNTRPETGESISSLSASYIAGQPAIFDVNSRIDTMGTYSFYLQEMSFDYTAVASAENGVFPGPELLVSTRLINGNPGKKVSAQPAQLVKVYPNPMIGNQQIVVQIVDEETIIESISILNVHGRKMSEINTIGENGRFVEFSFEGAKGVYLIQMKTNRGILIQRIIRQ